MGFARVRLCLPQHCDAHDRLLRERELSVQRAQYEWVCVPGLPPHCRGVPDAERFVARQRDRMRLDVWQSIADAALSSIKWLRRQPGKVSDYSLFYPLRPVPSVARRWTTDEEFGRQRLDGINPFMITAVDALPPHFPADDELLRAVLPEGTSLRRVLDEGRLFLVDYADLADAPLNIGCYLTPAMGLFWVDQRRRLMPLAVQLGQSPSTAPVIFTPADTWWVWLTARTFFQEADGNHHEIVAHLTRTHLVMETFWVAACRTLPPQHPIAELLRPHFTGTIAINDEARTTMLAPGGPIDQVLAVGSEGAYWLIDQEYREWSFDRWNPREEMQRRGVLDPDRLPGYHYRDDALRLFDAISAYVADLIGVFYRRDDDVLDDWELQAWAFELESDNGGRVRGLPTSEGRVRTVEALRELLHQVIYLVSVEHSAVNNGQYDQFGYIPNTPGAIFLPAPPDRSLINEAEYVYFLPMPRGVEQQIGMVELLSEPTLTPLGAYSDAFFQSSPEARLVVDRFQARLSEIQVAIEERNAGLAVPYDYLTPARVGRSIAI
jgi:arachidonate 15-lipoxygenase